MVFPWFSYGFPSLYLSALGPQQLGNELQQFSGSRPETQWRRRAPKAGRFKEIHVSMDELIIPRMEIHVFMYIYIYIYVHIEIGKIKFIYVYEYMMEEEDGII